MKKVVFIAAMSAAAIAMISCKQEVRAEKSDNSPIPVRILTVSADSVEMGTNYIGRVEPSKSAVVLGRFPGTIEALYAVKGKKVTKGTVLARINSEAVKSAYEIASAALKQAEDGMARAEQVYAVGSITEVKMVEIRTKLEQARAAEKSAREAIENCVVKAPFSGIIGDVYCNVGENVIAAAPIVQILDVDGVEIHFNVPESEYAGIDSGSKAEIEVPALERTVSGTVAVKGASASALSHAYDFTVKDISDPSGMMPGMVCRIRIRNNGKSSIVIPATAVMTDMQGRYIWGVTSEDKVCKTYVTVGGYAGKGVIISHGLSAGDRVIVEGSRKVSTGMKVKAVE